ncbi:WD40 repeat-like protein [Terfezia boudieri ATCC MYA-4762]|uniref:Polyadenylation factor subunit 2 n=1 Tax=Terfezia boudieri ATCC MYA-4762 TaxID=1051890 RepID=A0A3N4LAI5_9PEZI|nr:WD40 repeat-like protein [Terfezia boudieri ATCC MYA-4762]
MGGNQMRPAAQWVIDLLPPAAYADNPAISLCTKHAHASLNKIKHPINVVKWTPEGRRLLTGSSSGEFTLWNGMGFNFETIMQAHDCAIRVAQYSHGDDWLLSGDQDGIIKYWQPNFNNVKVLQAHTEPIRDLSFAPTDAKFVTASDDGTLRIWNFNEGTMERSLSGHGWDVKSVDWHPTKGLIVSGSKDHLVKLWDPRSARCLTTLHGHKNTITKSKFQPTRGDLLATSARDQTCRIFDLRAMKDFAILRGHEKDISTLAWHPVHPSLISTGGSDGALNHYLLDEISQDSCLPSTTTVIHPAHSVPYAHEFAIWSMEYHPMGHILCTGSNDRITRFWVRPRPGEVDGYRDRYHIGEAAAEAMGGYSGDRRGRGRMMREEEEGEEEDMEGGLVDQKMPVAGQGPNNPMLTFPGLKPGGPTVPLPIIPGFPPPPPPPPQVNGAVPGLGDLSALVQGGGLQAFGQLFPGGLPPVPPPPPVPSTQSGKQQSQTGSTQAIPPPPLPGLLPPGLVPPPGMLPPGFPGLPGLGMPPIPGLPGLGMPGLGGIEGAGFGAGGGHGGAQGGQGGGQGGGQSGQGSGLGRGSGGRSRAPLPSQEESLRENSGGGGGGGGGGRRDPRRRN